MANVPPAGTAGQQLASGNDIRRVTVVAIAQLNAKASPWIWRRPPPPKRVYRLKMTYRIYCKERHTRASLRACTQ